MIVKLWLALCLAFAACSGHAATPEKAVTSAELAPIREQLDKLEQELAIHKQTLQISLDTNDKRLADFGALATMQGSHTTWVGNLIAIVSVAITILVFGAGILTFRGAKKEASDTAEQWCKDNAENLRKEARETAQLWFDEQAQKLKAQIQQLQQKAEAAHKSIDAHLVNVKDSAQTARQTIDDASRSVLESAARLADGTPQTAADKQAIEVVRQESDALKDKPESSFTADDHYTRGVDYFAAGNYQSALSAFDKGLALLGKETSDQKTAHFLFAKGVTLGLLDKSEEAIAVYDEIDQRFGKDESPDMRKQVAKALVNKGVRLGTLAKSFEEIAVYDEIDRRFGKDASSGMREWVATGLVNKGITLVTLGKSEDAIAVYDEIDRRFGKDASPGMRELVTMVLVNKGVRLGTMGKPEEAIAVYDEIDRRFGKDESPDIREQVAMALVNKGVRLGTLAKSDEEIAVYDEIDRRFGKDASPGIRELVAMVLVNKGVRLGTMGKPEEAIAVYDEIDRRYGKDASPSVREQVANAMNGLGFAKIMLAKTHWPDETQRQAQLSAATPALERALALCAQDKRAIVLGNLGYCLFLAGQQQAARAPTLECLQLGGQKALDAQCADAVQQRVSPEDSQYEQLLDELWNSLQPPAA